MKYLIILILVANSIFLLGQRIERTGNLFAPQYEYRDTLLNRTALRQLLKSELASQKSVRQHNLLRWTGIGLLAVATINSTYILLSSWPLGEGSDWFQRNKETLTNIMWASYATGIVSFILSEYKLYRSIKAFNHRNKVDIYINPSGLGLRLYLD